jgi:hypothetical protein
VEAPFFMKQLSYHDMEKPDYPKGNKECPNCQGEGSWYDIIWETYNSCNCKKMIEDFKKRNKKCQW